VSRMLRARVDRHRCIAAGNCITLAPTAFDWIEGDIGKAEVVDAGSVEEELLREAALSCPTQAIELVEVEELLPFQLRGKSTPGRRVAKTFMFTDIVGSTALVEALGDEAWTGLLRWHDEALREQFVAFDGEVVSGTGDGFFVGFDSPDSAIGCAVAIQRRLDEQRRRQGFALKVRVGLHASDVTRVGSDYRGRGVHEAARISALAEGGEILASRETAADSRFATSEPREVVLKGISDPVQVVSIAWA